MSKYVSDGLSTLRVGKAFPADVLLVRTAGGQAASPGSYCSEVPCVCWWLHQGLYFHREFGWRDQLEGELVRWWKIKYKSCDMFSSCDVSIGCLHYTSLIVGSLARNGVLQTCSPLCVTCRRTGISGMQDFTLAAIGWFCGGENWTDTQN